MRFTLRAKFLFWLVVHTLAVYIVLGFGLYLFNQHEQREHPEDVEEEREELLIIYGIMLVALPVAVGGAWLVTGQLLQPLQSMLRTADQIRAGAIEQRLETPVASDELGRLARKLNEGFDNYQRLLERVDRFSLDAAHQLRGPLGAMRATAEVCLQQPRTREQYEETLGRIIEESRRLGHTVDQLLLLARLNRETLREVFEPVELVALVRRLIEGWRPVFDERGVRLELQLPKSPVRLRGSERLIEQAVANLLDNALRITPAGGQVSIELTSSSAHRLELSVSDSGPGLDTSLKPGPIVPDFRPAKTAITERTGLGLLIVSNIARAHGGTVQATISQWNGARFVLDLPAMS